MNRFCYCASVVIFSCLINCSRTFMIPNLLPGFRPTAAYPSGLPPANNGEGAGYASILGGSYYNTHNQEYGYINPFLPHNANPYTESAFLLRLYCTQNSAFRVQIKEGFVNVYCVYDRTSLTSLMFGTLPSAGMAGHPLVGWVTADKVLQSKGFVPICTLHCKDDKKPTLSVGNYIKPVSSNVFSVGCSDIASTVCHATCSSDVYKIDNGQVFCSLDLHVGSTCSAKCNSGYRLVGRKSKTCKDDMFWSDNGSFKCMVDKLAKAVLELQEEESLVAEDAIIRLREMLEYRLRTNYMPSTSRDGEQNTNEMEEDLELYSLVDSYVNMSMTTPVTLKSYSVCSVPMKERLDCGFPGITETECKAKGCCWDASEMGAKWCFYRMDERPYDITTKHTTKVPARLLSTNFLHHAFLTTLLGPNDQDYNAIGGEVVTIQSPGAVDNTQCGCSKQSSLQFLRQSPQTRIYGGEGASAEKWPWQAIVFHGDRICGGTLISRNFVVTAAHCVMGSSLPSDDSNKVLLGMTSRATNDPGKQSKKMKRIIRHPLFVLFPNGNAQNDIALIQLLNPVDFTSTVSPICLPGKRVPPAGSQCTITGFGKQTHGTAAETLQSARLRIMSTTLCNRHYPNQITPGQHLCGGGDSANSADACKGDSGGPLVCRSSVDSQCGWYLAGITSFGKSPCGGGSPGVYVNVSHYQDWIASYINSQASTG